MKVLFNRVIGLYILIQFTSGFAAATPQDQSSLNSETSWITTSDKLIEDLLESKTCNQSRTKFEIKLINSTFPNAFVSNDSSLNLSSGLLDRIDSSEELAFVLAHEASHVILGHHLMMKPNSNGEFLNREIEADALAARLLRAKKYNPRIGITVLKKLTGPRHLGGLPVSQREFPSIEPRIAQLARLE